LASFLPKQPIPDGVPLLQDSLDGAERVTPYPHPLFFVDKTPDGPHKMGNRDVHAPCPENLGDPMHGEPTTMGFQDLFLILSQCVDLGLNPTTLGIFQQRYVKRHGIVATDTGPFTREA
jgi:hypothetical protein